MTIFGAPWHALRLEHVSSFLEQADDEPLLWEAKGTQLDKNEVRRQICGFANSHEGGYLILGANWMKGGPSKWELPGVEFPDEPRTWIAAIVGDPERGVRPRPDFDVEAWPAADGHVALVWVKPTPTPPCITNGTVYERLPGKTQTVRDPLRLADLFSRGDEAHKGAQLSADRAARNLMESHLEAPAGDFRSVIALPDPQEEPRDATQYVRFSVGVASTGNAPNIAGRLFRDEFAEDVWQRLRERPTGIPRDFANPPDPVGWSQDALTWRHQAAGFVPAVTIVRVAWDGSAAVGEKLGAEDVHYPDSLVRQRIAPAWVLADELLQRLGGFGDVYVTVRVAGGSHPRPIVMRRGPLLPGVASDHEASLAREFMRAVGNPDPEP